MRVQLRAIIKGSVQGVGFRAAAKRLAGASKLTGFARNAPDGSVEICAQGERNQLENFLALLKERFSITSLETEFSSPTQIYPDFQIIP